VLKAPFMKITRRRLFAGFAALGAIATGGGTAQAKLSRYYDGPPSDHFNGLRFFDPNGSPPRGFADLLKWRLSGSGTKWPLSAPSQYTDRPPARVFEGIRVSFVGHASLLVQTGGLNFLFDPVWSERASPVTFAGPKRVNDPGIPFEQLPPIDFVFVTHCHYDHLDVTTLSRLAASHKPRVITPLGNDTIMHAHDPNIGAKAYDWFESADLGNGAKATLVPARHWSARGLLDRNKALWAGFVLATPAGLIYVAGDSGYGDGRYFKQVREKFGPPKLAVLPIGAYEPRWFMREQHMNPEEAVRAYQNCGAEFALGYHFGTFQLTDEAIDAPRAALKAALAAAEIAPGKFRALDPGEVWEIA
jgi:L-ascorbate metabolism protein UlaG (beta-lactamase superfamily)